MIKTLTSIAAAAVIALPLVAAPQDAQARSRGGAVAAGIIGGLAVGAIIGSAAANNHYGYGGYGGYGYYGPGPVYYAPRCHWARERYWNGWRWRSHRVRICY